MSQVPPDASLSSNDELCSRYIDIWKQTVEVQQHFNDLEWRIRGLALTAATFALGASALAAKNGTNFHGFSVGTAVIIAGLILWFSFYFVDRYWYHALLIGSVIQGTKIEEELVKLLPRSGLTMDITEASHIEPPRGLKWVARNNTDKKLHSEDKLKVFYSLGAVALVLTALMLQLAACASSKGPQLTPERVIEVIGPTDKPLTQTMTVTAPAPVTQLDPAAPG